jgi:hypothetical protein
VRAPRCARATRVACQTAHMLKIGRAGKRGARPAAEAQVGQF